MMFNEQVLVRLTSCATWSDQSFCLWCRVLLRKCMGVAIDGKFLFQVTVQVWSNVWWLIRKFLREAGFGRNCLLIHNPCETTWSSSTSVKILLSSFDDLLYVDGPLASGGCSSSGCKWFLSEVRLLDWSRWCGAQWWPLQFLVHILI